jgi:ferric-dicitrate binding protein FerR (iron transport regulator)
MDEQRFWLLVSLKCSGEASETELRELEQMLKAYPDMQFRMELYAGVWEKKHPGFPAHEQGAFERHLQRLADRFPEAAAATRSLSSAPEALPVMRSGRQPHLFVRLSAAAVLLLAVSALVWYYSGAAHTPNPIAQNTVSTRPGSRSKIQLSDGTEVWLNADSRLLYDQFSGANREVELTGEAYFDVAKDPDHPFLIHTASIDIKVLGTAFNVRSYSNERNTETSLFRGSVEVTVRNNPEKKIILKPNEKLIVQNAAASMPDPGRQKARDENEPLITVSRIHFQSRDSSARETLWMNNKLSFDAESLEAVALKIERWYDVKVIITDDRLKQTSYTAVFEDESLRQVMEALRITGGFHYSINKKEVEIRP